MDRLIKSSSVTPPGPLKDCMEGCHDGSSGHFFIIKYIIIII